MYHSILGLRVRKKKEEGLAFDRANLLLPDLELTDANVYAPYVRALLGTTAHFCQVAVLKSRQPRAQLKHLARDVSPNSALGSHSWLRRNFGAKVRDLILGDSLCLSGIAYRRFYGVSVSGLFKKTLCIPPCGTYETVLHP